MARSRGQKAETAAALTADQIRDATGALIERDAALREAAMDRELFPGAGITARDVFAKLGGTGVDLDSMFPDGCEDDQEEMVKKFLDALRPAIVGQLVVSFFQGDKAATTLVGKLATDPYMARVRAQVIRKVTMESPRGRIDGKTTTEVATLDGPAPVLTELLRSGRSLPKNFEAGRQVLADIVDEVSGT